MCVDDRRPVRARYLVICPQILVAQDLAQTLLEYDPYADITIAQSPGAVRVDDASDFRIAFIAWSPDAGTLASALRHAGCRVILTGAGEVPAPAEVYETLDHPFTARAVSMLLRNA